MFIVYDNRRIINSRYENVLNFGFFKDKLMSKLFEGKKCYGM